MKIFRLYKWPVVALFFTTLSGCSLVNGYLSDSQQEVGYYRIYDVKTTETPQTLIAKLQDTIAAEAQANFFVSSTYLNSHSQKPSRFQPLGLVDPHQKGMDPKDPRFAGYRAISCPRSAWTANAVRNDGTYFQACLYVYKGGYQLDLFARYLKKQGKMAGLTTSVINYVGHDTDETWAEAFFNQIPQELRSSLNAQVKLVESLPISQ